MMLCAVISVTSGCVSTGSTTVASGCSAFTIIRPSRQDTLETKRQVLAHNTVYREVCVGAK